MYFQKWKGNKKKTHHNKMQTYLYKKKFYSQIHLSTLPNPNNMIKQ